MNRAPLPAALWVLVAAAPADAQIIGRVARTSDCIFQSAISEFRVLGNRHIVLLGHGPRDAYIAELSSSCFDLAEASRISTIDGDRNGQICGYGRDAIGFVRLAHVEECGIVAMERLSLARRDELLGTESGAAAPAKEKKKDRGKRKDGEEQEKKEEARAAEPPAGESHGTAQDPPGAR